METVFDHAPTPEELTELFGATMSQEDYVRFHAADEMTENGRLYRLFTLRGKSAEAGAYLERIPDPLYRYNVQLIDIR